MIHKVDYYHIEILDNIGAVVDTTVVWSLSDSTLASIDSNGLLTALAEGEVTVTASVGDVSDTVIVTITEPVALHIISRALTNESSTTSVI